MSSGRAQDFARITLPLPPKEYTVEYMRELIARLENLIASRVSRLEQQPYWGTAYIFTTGTNNAQAITAATNTVVEFDMQEKSTDALVTFRPATFDFLIAPVANLIFLIKIKNDGTTGTCRIILRKNGSISVAAIIVTVSAGIDLIATFSALSATGDSFDIVILPTNAMNLDLTQSSCIVIRISADPRLSRL